MKRALPLAILLALPLTTGGCIGYPRNFGIAEIGLTIFLLPALVLYFLPTIIAAARHKRDMLGIVLVNVLAGWTLVGWIIALVWAFTADR